MVRMDTYRNPMAAQFRGLLARRARELGRTLSHEADGTRADVTHEVDDFAEAAVQEALARVQDANAEHAAAEMQLIRAALRRIADGDYGQCLDSGEAIDLRRLEAVPTAAYCAACQAAHERH
jgi:DnaK suppressor protein